MFSSPFSTLTKNQEIRLTRALLFLVVLCIAVLQYLDQFLINDTCSGGIIAFELAGDLETAGSYLNSWGEKGKIAVSLGLGIDFLFPIAYSLLMAILIHKLNALLWFKRSFFIVGNVLIWAIFLAGIFDYIENIGLINLVLGNMDQFWVSVAFYFATIKFFIILVVFSYIFINFSLFLIKKWTK
ncbi:hypothetical protein N9F38_00385 [Flavobacteriaceae bacterium]|nr:hypothetical protein [Flavobacteriaceae bacterium]